MTNERTCRHCGRRIISDSDGRWIDPEATGDDVVWRETCDSHDTFTAEHEPAAVRSISVRDEYAPRFGRQVLTLWSGAFASDYEGEALELPGHNGYMVHLAYSGSVRVECEAPRTEANYLRVDAAISAAVNATRPAVVR